MAGIIGNSVNQQIKAHNQEAAGGSMIGKSFAAVQSPVQAPQPADASAYYPQLASALADTNGADSDQALGRKLLQQQAAAGPSLPTSLAAMGSEALGGFANK